MFLIDALTYRPDELVHTGEPFFSLDTTLHLPLVALLVPDLEPFVELAHEMSADLVIDDTVETTTSILGWVSDVHARLASLRIVGHACRRHLYLFELHSK